MNLTQLIEEQKKEAKKNLGKTLLATGGTQLDIEITTAITKGYELALEEVDTWIRANIQDDGSTGTKVNAHTLVCFIQAHLKENVVE